MSYLDESDYENTSGYDDTGGADERRSRRGSEGRRRASQPARPAWDAATYGTPDDVRRAARPAPPSDRYPPLNFEEPPRYDPAPYEPPPYDPAPYEPPRFEESRYASSSETSHGFDAYPAARTTDYVGGIDYAQPDYAQPDYAQPDYSASTDYLGSYGESAAGNGYLRGLDDDRTAVTPGLTEDGAAYPGGATEPVPAARHSRAGRNLPAAIGVGVGLAAAAVGSLFLWRPAFLAVVAVAVGVGIWELVRAIRTTGVNPPLIPLVVGGGLMSGLAWWGHVDALTFGLIVTVLAAMVWRLADGAGGYGRDVTAATLVAVYVPFLAGFAALLASSPADGDLRVLVTLAGVVLSDTGGYVAGVFFGRHPMAPSVSPKKSWEGLAGSLFATAIGGAVLLYLLFDVQPWWGALFGLAVSAAAVLGDLGESMIKRDLGVKDMSSLLPGHGGLMDRLDSIVFAAPTAYVLLILLAPPA
jgi:phosphatidate cytidylyltransferase